MNIDTQGQISIPPEIRDQLGWTPGTEIQIEISGEALWIRKKPPSNQGKLLVESLRGKATANLSTDQIMVLSRENT